MSDLISRDAAIDAIHVYWMKCIDALPIKIVDGFETCTGNYEEILEHNKALSTAIKDLPSAQPERPTGYLHLLDECANAGYYCSKCQKKVVREGWSKTVKKIKFCPNCGCKMEVEHEIG